MLSNLNYKRTLLNPPVMQEAPSWGLSLSSPTWLKKQCPQAQFWMISHSWQSSVNQTGKERLRAHDNKSRGKVPSNTHFTCKAVKGDSLLGLPPVNLPWQVWLSSDRTSPLGHSHWYVSSTSIQVWLQPPLLLWQPSISAKEGEISTHCFSGSCQSPAYTPGWLTNSMASTELEGSSTVSLLSR